MTNFLLILLALKAITVSHRKPEDVLLAAGHLRHLTHLEMRDMSEEDDDNITTPAARLHFGKYISTLIELRSFRYYSAMRMNADDTDALCRLPNLQVLRLGMPAKARAASSSDRIFSAPPSAEAAKWLTRLVELSAWSSWATDEILLRFQNLKCLTRLY